MVNDNIVSIRQGDGMAFARLYDRLAEPALRYAAAMLGRDGLAADAVQEAFLRAYRHIGRFDAGKPFEPWFFRILRNECRRAARWRGRLTPVQSIPEGSAPEQSYGALYEAIERLDGKLREPLVLRYLLGYSDEETARMLGISLAAEKGRVKRAKQKLRNSLGNGDA